jgi:putative transposase
MSLLEIFVVAFVFISRKHVAMQELSELSADDRELALSRYQLLQPYLEYGHELRSIADRADVSFRTLQRWVAQYRKSGLASLVRKPRADRGERRAVSTKIRQIIEGLALEKPPLPVTSIHRQVRKLAETIGEPVPSYWMVYDLIRDLPESLRILAHKGTRIYGEPL